MPSKTRAGKSGVKHRITLAIPVGCQLPVADNSGAKLVNVISVYSNKGVLNRLPSGAIGDVLLASVRKGKPDMRKKLFQVVIIRQKKPWKRIDGTYVYCEDNAGVIINNRGDPKGSAINGPVAKECGDLFPKIVSNASAVL
jgi:large subunit ribosomal protein L23e